MYIGSHANYVIMASGGAIQAFDSRENNSTTAGHLGGLLQASTYVSGLSGGGWLLGSIFLNNFTTISSLLYNHNTSSIWEFENSIFEGPATGGLQLFDTAKYFDHIYDAVSDKADAGFQTSLTDYWGRALSYQLINATDGGPEYTWSSIALTDDFRSGDVPMPLLVADGRAPDETLVSGNATVYEVNPWELGTWDPTSYAFAPLEFLGSNFSNGVLPKDVKCVRGFDNAGYIMGTSSSLFNQFLIQIDGLDIPDVAKNFVSKILGHLSTSNNDIADYSPNPFLGYHNSTSLISDSQRLTLVDGGEDLQNIPLYPLIQPYRQVDVIFAVDSSADSDKYWPNGTSLVATYERSLTKLANGTSFPAVPGQNSFVNLGLNTHPTFFGCNSSNTTHMTPLIVYIPNFPYIYHSNFSTFDLRYNTSARNAIVQNGYEVATMGNGTSDAQWPTCVGCAILSRSMERTETTVPDVCQQCFKKYCWDGTVNNTTPGPYDPKYVLQAVDTKKSTAGGRDVTLCLVAFMAILTTFVLNSSGDFWGYTIDMSSN